MSVITQGGRRRELTFRGAAEALARLTLGESLCGRHGVFVSKEKPKHESVRDQKERHDKCREIVGSAQLTGLDAQANAVVIGMEDIGAAPKIEYPGHDDAQPAGQQGQR